MFRQSIALTAPHWKETIYNENHSINEYVDERLLCSIIEYGENIIYTGQWGQWKKYFPDLKTHLFKYHELFKDGKIVSKLYQPKHKWGRVNVMEQISLSVLHRKTRHTLAYQFYKDIDMVNAEPCAFYEMLKQYGVAEDKLEILKDYCENRKLRISEIISYYNLQHLRQNGIVIMTAEERVKKWFLGLFNGGDLNTIIIKNDLSNLRLECNPYLLNFWNKYQEIIDIIAEPNRHIYEDYCISGKDNGDDESDIGIKRKIVAFMYQTIERKLQETAICFLVESRGLLLEDIIPSQDGIMVRKGIWRDEFITGMEDAVNSKFGFKIPFKIKEFDERFEIDLLSDEDFEEFKENRVRRVYYANNDTEASELVFNKIKRNLKSCDNRLYYKLNNCWVYGEEVSNVIKSIIKEMNIQKKIEKTGKKGVYFEIKDYSAFNTGVESIYKQLLLGLNQRVRDDDFYKKLHSSTQGKLAFLDGVLDFVNREFIKWRNPKLKEYYTTVIINRDFNEYFNKPNYEKIDDIRKNIIESLVGVEDTPLFLHFLSRAIAGFNGDKNLASYMGNRNSGKGILYTLLTAFDAYVGSFDLENIICARQNMKSNDIARENAWLVPLEFVRIGVSQETDETEENGKVRQNSKINNKALKSFQSGGDNIDGREPYGKVIRFRIDTTAVIMGNSDIVISGSGDGNSQILRFAGVNQFISKEEYDRKIITHGALFCETLRRRDDDLKNKIQLGRDYKDAIVMLLYNSYSHKPATKKEIINDEMINDVEKHFMTSRERIFEKYEITKNDKDRVSKDDFHADVGGDKKKIIEELKSLGCIGDCNCKCYITVVDENGKDVQKRVMAYKGLKKRVISNDIENSVVIDYEQKECCEEEKY